MRNKNVKIVSLSGDYIIPQVKETRTRKSWVEYGIYAADDFFETVTKRYLTSATNTACIDGVTQLLYGLGLKAEDAGVEALLEEFTDQVEIKRIVMDYKLYGALAIQCVFSPDREKIIGFYHLPVDTLRSEKCDENGEIGGYWYSPDWTNPKVKPTYIPRLGTGEYENDVQVLYFKRHTPGAFYYSLPDWYSSIQYACTEEEISNLHISNIRNGFMPSAIINFNGGSPPDEEQAMIEASIANQFTGTSNAGRFILSFNESAEQKTTVDVINSQNLHDNYKFISEEAREKIMLSHKITSPLLLGIRTATGFSSNAEELKTSYDVFDKLVITPMQGELLKAFGEVLEVNGIDGSTLFFEKLIPYQVEAEITEDVGEAKAEEIINDQGQEENEATVNVNVEENV